MEAGGVDDTLASFADGGHQKRVVWGGGSMTYLEVANALLPRIGSMSVLKVCLAVASQTDCARQQVRLAVTDFIDLTGLSKQSVLNGLDAALEQGWIAREPAGKSFWYTFETKNLTENGTSFRRRGV